MTTLKTNQEILRPRENVWCFFYVHRKEKNERRGDDEEKKNNKIRICKCTGQWANSSTERSAKGEDCVLGERVGHNFGGWNA